MINKSIKNITTTMASYNNVLAFSRDMKQRYESRFMYTATLNEEAYIYSDVMAFIDKSTNTRNFKFLADRNGIHRYYNSESSVWFNIGEYRIKAALNKPENSGAGDSDNFSQMIGPRKKNEITFTTHTAEGLKALENLMNDMIKSRQKVNKDIWIASMSSFADWDYENISEKSLDSVFLPLGEKESLTNDIDRFLSSEEKFKIVGIPWHRGYCFYGEPGNGKSSLALALANHYEMDLYNLPLSSVKDDGMLSKAIGAISKKSILLLEDIDIFSDSMYREQKKDSPTLAGLLNALDGVSTPNGLITIMTTNHLEKLDEALVRPGRMDYKLELKPPVKSQIEEMFARVFDEPLGLENICNFKSMAAVSDVFKRNLDDPEAVRQSMKV